MKNIFLILLVILMGCSANVEKPNDLIPESEMVLILIDIHKLEAKLSRLRVKNDSLVKVFNTFERELLKEHGTTKDIYENSYEYYMARPEALEKIYEVVVDSLNVAEQQATIDQNKAREKAGKKNKAKPDSVKSKPVLRKEPKFRSTEKEED